MKVLVHPTYFPSIATFAVLAQREVVWEGCDNFQKQTYRNRCHICTDKGAHSLHIPIRHVGGLEGRQKYAEVATDNSYPWKKIHWRSLETAYRTSPFFEYYEDGLRPLFEDGEGSLLAFNLRGIEAVADCLGIPAPKAMTDRYRMEVGELVDARFLVRAKGGSRGEPEPYTQVFGERHGFIPDRSVLDLVFNMGGEALDYLRRQSLDFLDD